MPKLPTSDEQALRTRIAHVLRNDPTSYQLLIAPEIPDYAHLHRLQDVLDSLALESDPVRPEDVIALLHALSDEVRLGDDPSPTSPSMLLDVCSTVVSSWDSDPPPLAPLTTRERDVLHLLVNGLSNREIAHVLMVTVNTVKTHLSSIYSKLAVHNRMEAAVRARKLHLL